VGIDLKEEKPSLPWFALQTRSRYENFVANHLRDKGYELFLPVYKCRRRWSDRVKEFELPLFPNYLFCRFDPLARFPILVTPGIIQVLGIGKNLVPVDDAEVIGIQKVVQSGLPRRPWPFLQAGQRVRVDYGPLRGVEGSLVEFKGYHRLILSVALLQRSVSVEVDAAWVTSVPERHKISLGAGGLQHPQLPSTERYRETVSRAS